MDHEHAATKLLVLESGMKRNDTNEEIPPRPYNSFAVLKEAVERRDKLEANPQLR